MDIDEIIKLVDNLAGVFKEYLVLWLMFKTLWKVLDKGGDIWKAKKELAALAKTALMMEEKIETPT